MIQAVIVLYSINLLKSARTRIPNPAHVKTSPADSSEPTSLSPELEAALEELLRAAGASSAFGLRRLAGGANNRAWRVDAGGESFVLKQYYGDPPGQRDRLACEFAFLEFARTHDVRCVPRPRATDPARRLGLMEFIDGRPLTASQLTPDHVDEAARFFRDLNRCRELPDAAALPDGAEACLTLEEHRAVVKRRVERLGGIVVADEVDREAARFVAELLEPAWRHVDSELEEWTRREDAARPIDQRADDRRGRRSADPGHLAGISPSDFGFHNALVGTDGRLRFLDFEYAGWDDPARMLCDFFLQVRVPVPIEFLDRFAQIACGGFDDAAALLARARGLFPIYRIKWCCLLLNEFLKASAERRRFAGRTVTPDDKARQLDLARDLLART